MPSKPAQNVWVCPKCNRKNSTAKNKGEFYKMCSNCLYRPYTSNPQK